MSEDRKSLNISEKKIRKDFNNAMIVIGLSSVWVFAYLIASKGGFRVLSGTGAYVFVITMSLLLLGMAISRKMLWSVIENLIYFNQQTIKLERELMEEHKLATIAKTTLSLSHEINNPLMIMRGNIEVLNSDIEDQGSKLELSEIKRRIFKIREHCNKISEATDKLLNITKPVETVVHGDIKMFDPNS